jgi:hypothetical protein
MNLVLGSLSTGSIFQKLNSQLFFKNWYMDYAFINKFEARIIDL